LHDWTLPPTLDPLRTTTFFASSAWTLPTTRIELATSVARRSTLIVPLTVVPFRVHVAPSGTRRLSTVMRPSEPRQVRSSACAAGAVRIVAHAVISASIVILRMGFSSLDESGTSGYRRNLSLRREQGVSTG
jgi:hypothetical protein